MFALLTVEEEVDDLPPNRHVQRGRRLIKEQQLRLDQQGAGDAQTLQLAATDLAGPSFGDPGLQPNLTDRAVDGVALVERAGAVP